MSTSRFDRPYDPRDVEDRLYRRWEEKGFFHADETRKESRPYCIVMPPPNITGSLHIGHALNQTLQDILIRWKRMQGHNALWLPGTDHAGIATQNVVEKRLMAEGKSRETLGREKFIERVWKWREESGRTILGQLKRLGASCDWKRERFTMDRGLSDAVREVFVRLYEDGLIYRGERLINWCPRCGTALSDIEVEHEEIKGKMYYIKYPLAGDPGTHLTVATTRPETMLGDTAVAVHPDDSRYNRLIGHTVLLPLTRRRIPVVGDSLLVDREFGTGAVKITPAHDFNDEKAGQRHGLPRISILDEKARIQPVLPDVDPAVMRDIAMQPAAEARNRVVRRLEERGDLVKIEDHRLAVGKCYRCKTVVEPYLSPQWFVKVDDPKNSLAAPAIEAVRDNRIRIVPEGWKNNYVGWMENIQDWCISRQIWWGHQIPAWYCRTCNSDSALHTRADGTFIIGKEASPIVARTDPKRCPRCGGSDLVRDPDVLDTWFSSALWPFSTLGWPEKTRSLEVFYPTSVLVTSFDILFFWVARMIMMGLYFMKEVPFRDVYIHALVRDAEGQKMSKSKGNVIDPLDIMDRHGTDALRFTLASMASPGRDIKLSEERIEGNRNFANKIWNAARFLLMNCPNGARPYMDSPLPGLEALPLADRWILSRLKRTVSSVNRQMDAYRFDEASKDLYQFLWNEYCDWYLEWIKPVLYGQDAGMADRTRTVAIHVFETVLRLLHPFMPFITEEIRQAMTDRTDSIVVAPYPKDDPALIDEWAELEVEMIKSVVVGIRGMRNVHSVSSSKKWSAMVQVPDQEIERSLSNNRSTVMTLAKLDGLTIGRQIEPPLNAFTGTVVFPEGRVGEIYIPWTGDTTDTAKETAKSEKRLKEVAAQMEQEEKRLANSDFVEKAPPEILQKTKTRYEELRVEHEKLSTALRQLRERTGGKA